MCIAQACKRKPSPDYDTFCSTVPLKVNLWEKIPFCWAGTQLLSMLADWGSPEAFPSLAQLSMVDTVQGPLQSNWSMGFKQLDTLTLSPMKGTGFPEGAHV